MVVMSIENYEKLQEKLELYGKLAEAEAEINGGAEGIDFVKFEKNKK